ncbi:hypothetical protein H2200_003774 [Cladophialophora chaetospira]|uniref:Uncharacterized protein n=1 Tax=Cladophialophora chaetospira TaxID=386627 RepID=A0AA38XF14_9EURO|nr:hypothetical protein H2200_003774 [Cladophialophora chaetospira]
MKIGRLAGKHFRKEKVIPIDRLMPRAERETVRYIRYYDYLKRGTRFSRCQESVPVKCLNGVPSSAYRSRKCNPLKPIKKVGVVTSSQSNWWKRKAVAALKLEKGYYVYDTVAPMGLDSNGLPKYLSDLVEQGKWEDIDLDARQEREEAVRRVFEQYGDCEEVRSWACNFLASSRRNGTLTVLGLLSRRASNLMEQGFESMEGVGAAPLTPPSTPLTTCSPFEQNDWTPADVEMTSVEDGLELFPADSQVNAPNSWPMANNAPMTPATTPFGTSTASFADGGFADSCFNGWGAPPPTINDVDMATDPVFPQPSFSSVGAGSSHQPMLGNHVVSPAPTPSANKVDMTFKTKPTFFYLPDDEDTEQLVVNGHTVGTASPPVSNNVNVAAASTFAQSIFSSGSAAASQKQPMLGNYVVERATAPVQPPMLGNYVVEPATASVGNNANIASGPTFPQSIFSSGGAESTQQQPMLGNHVVEPAATQAGNNGNTNADYIAAASAARPEYRELLEEVGKFNPAAMKAEGALYEKLKHDCFEPRFDGRSLNSLTDFSSHPCRYVMKPTPNFPCLFPNDKPKFLGSTTRQALVNRYLKLWKKNRDVWIALLGTMLQEGVSPESLLMDYKEKAEVLEHKEWVHDLSRFDNLHYCRREGIPPSPGLGEFHKAPEGQAKDYYDEIHYLKSKEEAVHRCFRLLVSAWLERDGNNVEAFRNLARKAGWTPRDDYRVVLLRNFIIDTFKNRLVELAPIGAQAQEYLSARFPRFLAATLAEEGMDEALSSLC